MLFLLFQIHNGAYRCSKPNQTLYTKLSLSIRWISLVVCQIVNQTGNNAQHFVCVCVCVHCTRRKNNKNCNKRLRRRAFRQVNTHNYTHIVITTTYNNNNNNNIPQQQQKQHTTITTTTLKLSLIETVQKYVHEQITICTNVTIRIMYIFCTVQLIVQYRVHIYDSTYLRLQPAGQKGRMRWKRRGQNPP